MKLFITILSTIAIFSATPAVAGDLTPEADFYRIFTMRIQQKGLFRVFMPNGQHQDVKFEFEFGDPVYPKPILQDFRPDPSTPQVLRSFWDRVLLKDGSTLEIGGEKLPLTCIFISGQDNRFSGITSPLTPEFVLKVFLVANDFACQGPIRPGWPHSGGRKENWDTFLHFEVKDPTIMLPTDAGIRYRWNEYNAVWIDAGRQ